MAAERQGWNTWNRYLKAGIVDNTIMFTDKIKPKKKKLKLAPKPNFDLN